MSFAYENVKGVPIRNKRTAPPMIKNRVLRSSYPILDVQHRLGNQSVQNRIQRCPLFPQRCPTGGVCHLCPTSNGGSLQGSIQPKLKIGKPNDKYEQEADRVAEQVMRMPEPKIQKKSQCPLGDSSYSDRDTEEDTVQPKPISEQITPLIQRQVGEEEELEVVPEGKLPEEEEETEPVEEPEEEEEELQTKPTYGRVPQAGPGLQAQIRSMRGGGQPLSQDVRNYFEPRFGYDFSGVRVHTGAQATGLAQALNSEAFTIGQSVVFGSGQYKPETTQGNKLLAHELTHVLQQNHSSVKKSIQRKVSARAAKAVKEAEKLHDQKNPFIWFDSWYNDGRSNYPFDKRKRLYTRVEQFLDADNQREQKWKGRDGSHKKGNPWDAIICTNDASKQTKSLCPKNVRKPVKVNYLVCIDIPIMAYKAAGIPFTKHRSVASAIYYVKKSRHWRVIIDNYQYMTNRNFAPQAGDFVAWLEGNTGHSSIAISDVNMINLRGPSSAGMRWKPNRPNDIEKSHVKNQYVARPR